MAKKKLRDSNSSNDNVEREELSMPQRPAKKPRTKRGQSDAAADSRRCLDENTPPTSSRRGRKRTQNADGFSQGSRKMNLDDSFTSGRVGECGTLSKSPNDDGGPGPDCKTTYFLSGSEVTDENDKTVEIYGEMIIFDYALDGNRNKLLEDFCRCAHESNVHRFIEIFIEQMFPAEEEYRARASKAIVELHKARLVTQEHVEMALRARLLVGEDMVKRVPKYYEFMAYTMAPLFVTDDLNFTNLLRAVRASLGYWNTVKMLVPLFKRICEISVDGISTRWQTSGMNLSELVDGLHEQDVKDIEAAIIYKPVQPFQADSSSSPESKQPYFQEKITQERKRARRQGQQGESTKQNHA